MELSDKVRRKSRIVGEQSWINCNGLTIEQAAIRAAEQETTSDVVDVDVRDVDDQHTYEFLRVTRVVSYKVENLRGGE